MPEFAAAPGPIDFTEGDMEGLEGQEGGSGSAGRPVKSYKYDSLMEDSTRIAVSLPMCGLLTMWASVIKRCTKEGE